MRRLKGPDPVGLLQREPDIVQTVQQAVLPERVHLKGNAQTVRTTYLLPREIDRQGVALHRGSIEKRIDYICFQNNG